VSKIDVTQEQIDAELRTLAQHQKVLLELDQVRMRIRVPRIMATTSDPPPVTDSCTARRPTF